MSAGKGDRQRPTQVDEETFRRRWEKAFGPKKRYANEIVADHLLALANEVELDTARKELVTDGFILVYQGGHHDVWCDGAEHRKITGGYCDTGAGSSHGDPTPCDCHDWR